MITLRGQTIKDAQLFVYGTLCFPSVIRVLVGYEPTAAPCEAYDCSRYKIRDRVYPMLKLEAGGVVSNPAYVYKNLNESDWRILDAFEDPRYRLTELKTSEGPSLAYASCDESMQSDGPWLPTKFEQEHLTSYVAMCQKWRSSR